MSNQGGQRYIHRNRNTHEWVPCNAEPGNCPNAKLGDHAPYVPDANQFEGDFYRHADRLRQAEELEAFRAKHSRDIVSVERDLFNDGRANRHRNVALALENHLPTIKTSRTVTPEQAEQVTAKLFPGQPEYQPRVTSALEKVAVPYRTEPDLTMMQRLTAAITRDAGTPEGWEVLDSREIYRFGEKQTTHKIHVRNTESGQEYSFLGETAVDVLGRDMFTYKGGLELLTELA